MLAVLRLAPHASDCCLSFALGADGNLLKAICHMRLLLVVTDRM